MLVLQVQTSAVTLSSKAGRERQRDMPKEEMSNRDNVTPEQKILLLSAVRRNKKKKKLREVKLKLFSVALVLIKRKIQHTASLDSG